MVKKDGMILEKPPFAKGRRRDSKNITSIFFGKNPFSFRKDFQSPSAPHVSYPSRKD